MAWNDPNDAPFDVGDILTSQTMKDYVRDNLLALKDPPSADYVADEASADYTTTSTSFVNVNNTDGKYSLSITTSGGDIMVHFHGTIAIIGVVYFDLLVDDHRLAGGDGIIRYENNIGHTIPVSFTRLLTGMDADSHTIKLQWKSNGATAYLYAGAGTSGKDLHPQFWVREVS